MKPLALLCCVVEMAVASALATPSCAVSDGETGGTGETASGPGTGYLQAPYATLSEYHFDRDGVLVPYEVRNELFTDYADKSRGLYLPPGTKAKWAGEDHSIELPVGTILVKRFGYGARWIETRLLVHGPAGWRGHAYVWDEGQHDATLRPGGQTVEVDLTRPDGRRAHATHLVPSEQQCKKCHADNDEIEPHRNATCIVRSRRSDRAPGRARSSLRCTFCRSPAEGTGVGRSVDGNRDSLT